MVEPATTTPATTTPPAAGGPEPDVLLATKLHVPRPRPGLVPRPRLAERLTEGMGGGLVLVCTPAGFGKTTLLAHWAATTSWPVAWLSLDEGDNDPARFWRHVAAALDRTQPGVADRVAPLLGGPQAPSLEAVVTALVNQLAGADQVVVLVLDDYHLLQAPAVHQSVGFLLAHLPAQLRLVLASRADPPLPLARLRARGQLAELREADLRFTPQEAAELLRTAAGPDVPDAAVAALEERTEGWAAGLQLAALSLRGHGDRTGFVEGFSGSHRFVLDYLTEEVLDRQPESLRAFLLETSILARVCGPLAVAVTGRADSQQLLEQVERANLFLIPLDEERRWWRYHYLFADLLRARLQQADPNRVPGLHRAAAAWCEHHELVDDAIGHALAAGDATWAARLIERHFDAHFMQSEGATLQRWLAALPAELVSSRPRLGLAQTFTPPVAATDAIEPLLDGAERALAGAVDESYEPSVGNAASLLANVPAGIALQRAALAQLRGDADQTVVFARRALAELGEGQWMLESITSWYLAVAEWLRGRLAEAEDAFASNIACWRAAGQPSLAGWAFHYLGQVQQAQGRLGAALGTYREARRVVVEPGRAAAPLTGIAHVGMAEVAYRRGELDAALRYATEGIGLCRQFAYTIPLLAGLAVVAWIRQGQGDRAGALLAIGEAEQVQLGAAVVGLLNPVPALQARLALTNGEIDDAARWVQTLGLAAEDEPSWPREREYLVLARVLLASGHAGQALELLQRWHALAAAQGRTGSIIELQALQALAHAASGDQPAALATLAEALSLGAAEDYLRVFVDEGPPMAALVGKLLASRRHQPPTVVDTVPQAYLGRLVAVFEQAGLRLWPAARRGAVVVAGLLEPLTARELEVLGRLAAGQTNRGIAEELVVTLDTVKRHVSNILAKLQVTNRTQAVARARQLGLLP
jgi:LuxR family transcriptional regulator, maltose regulon positive regulatory protein